MYFRLEFDNAGYGDYLKAFTARKEASMPFKAYALFQVSSVHSIDLFTRPTEELIICLSFRILERFLEFEIDLLFTQFYLVN